MLTSQPPEQPELQASLVAPPPSPPESAGPPTGGDSGRGRAGLPLPGPAPRPRPAPPLAGRPERCARAHGEQVAAAGSSPPRR